ncbi:hypothetical protein ATANTOWER_025184 [Ataeniobius toweri]|uniref:Uncharacterized protein n=1 Tax=Ataeniobius toweri TaxID=208326 RepID=A0ABU7CJB8_9TELE|nr:hypothetical protein [Ataeniobius toweri]
MADESTDCLEVQDPCLLHLENNQLAASCFFPHHLDQAISVPCPPSNTSTFTSDLCWTHLVLLSRTREVINPDPESLYPSWSLVQTGSSTEQ